MGHDIVNINDIENSSLRRKAIYSSYLRNQLVRAEKDADNRISLVADVIKRISVESDIVVPLEKLGWTKERIIDLSAANNKDAFAVYAAKYANLREPCPLHGRSAALISAGVANGSLVVESDKIYVISSSNSSTPKPCTPV